jgi:hypothetical protein
MQPIRLAKLSANGSPERALAGRFELESRSRTHGRCYVGLNFTWRDRHPNSRVNGISSDVSVGIMEPDPRRPSLLRR